MLHTKHLLLYAVTAYRANWFMHNTFNVYLGMYPGRISAAKFGEETLSPSKMSPSEMKH